MPEEQQTQAQALVKIKQGLALKIPDLKVVVPKGVVAERYARQAYFAICKDPLLQQCTPSSLVMRVIEAAEVGLSLDRIMQEAALVPRRNKAGTLEAQLMPEYRGLLRLAHQHPDVDHVDVVEVFNKDLFAVTRGTKPGIDHELSTEEDPGPAVCYYAVVWFKSGQCKFEVMNLRQIESVRSRIKGSDRPDSAWVVAYGEQAKKTVLKRMLKTVPRTEHAAQALGQSDKIEAGEIEDAELVLEPTAAPEKVDPKKAEPPHSKDCTSGQEPTDVESRPADDEPPHPAGEGSAPVKDPEPEKKKQPAKKKAPAPAKEPEAAEAQGAEHAAEAQRKAVADAQDAEKEEALKGLGWDGPALVEPERQIDGDEKKLVRDILRNEKVTQAARGREWLEKETGKKIQKLDELTVLELVKLLKKYKPEIELARYMREDEQGEML